MRQVGAWALGRGMCAREGHVRQGGACAPGWGMRPRWGIRAGMGSARGWVRAKSDMCA